VAAAAGAPSGAAAAAAVAASAGAAARAVVPAAAVALGWAAAARAAAAAAWAAAAALPALPGPAAAAAWAAAAHPQLPPQLPMKARRARRACKPHPLSRSSLPPSPAPRPPTHQRPCTKIKKRFKMVPKWFFAVSKVSTSKCPQSGFKIIFETIFFWGGACFLFATIS